MRLDKIIKLSEISDFLEKNNITVAKSNVGIKLITKNNVKVIISQQPHVLPSEEPIIYLDSFVNAYGLPPFKRNWREGEDLAGYLVKIVVPFIVNLGGPYTVKENEIDTQIIKNLNDNCIEIESNATINLKFTDFDTLGNEIETFIDNRPVITFFVNEVRYGICYHKAYLDLLIFENNNENKVRLSYPWYSFCSVFLIGNDYIKAAVNGIVNFINQMTNS